MAGSSKIDLIVRVCGLVRSVVGWIAWYGYTYFKRIYLVDLSLVPASEHPNIPEAGWASAVTAPTHS